VLRRKLKGFLASALLIAKPLATIKKMNSSIKDLWNEFKSGLLSSSLLNNSIKIKNEFLPIELTELLTLNNGQNLYEDGIFKLIRNSAITNKWNKYKFLEDVKIIEILNKISTSQEIKYSEEIPFAISDEFENGNVCLTINKNDKKISVVTFGFKPENYDLREISSYVQDKNVISKDIVEFIKVQIMFNEME